MPTRAEVIDIPVEDELIAGTLVTPGTLVPGVLFVHGWGGSQQQYLTRAREVASLGCICLTFDLRGHERTNGRRESVSREDNLEDAIAAYDVLVHQPGVDLSSIAVVGSSYGGYLAAILSSLRPVRWLAIRAPALYKDSDWDLPKGQLRKHQDLDAYRLKPVRPDESVALKACGGFTGDVLLVESENDKTIPHQVVLNYRDACASAHSLSYRVIKGADHSLSDPRWQQAATSILVSWFTEMLGGARGHWEADGEPRPLPVGERRRGSA
jgi:hypothetical protein